MTNGKRTLISTRIDSPGELLNLLPSTDDVLCWLNSGDGLVGWGQLARCETVGAQRFRQAQQWWAQFTAGLAVHDEVGLHGSGAVAFASMAFADAPARSVLVVPRVLVGRRGDTTWVTHLAGDEVGDDWRCGWPGDVEPVTAPRNLRYGDGQLTVDGYRAAVAAAIEHIRAGELSKIALAHDLVATADDRIDHRHLLDRLAKRYSGCWCYAVDGLVGATPELLLRRAGDHISARLLAGTIWPRDGRTEDELAAELLASKKNRVEHAYAIESLADALREHCGELRVPTAPGVLRLANVTHLASEVHGTLADDVPLLRLAERVHPTAAVGGTPREIAVPLIAELERMDRGRYAGPVGWLDAHGNGELGVALRCAQVDGDTARLFAGCGIVADSDPDDEAEEAQAKFAPMLEALG